MKIKRGLALYLMATVILGIGMVFLVAVAANADPIVIDTPGTTYDCNGGTIYVSSSEAGIVITADDVTVQNCTITSASPELGDVGIVVLGADPVTIKDNEIHDLLEGIRLINTDGNTIQSNTIYNIGREIPGPIDPRTGICVHLEDSDRNDLWDNECHDSGVGLFLIGSDENSVEGDSYHNNAFVGVHLEESVDNRFGVEDLDTDGTIDGVTVTGNGSWGFYLIDSHNNVIQNSEISGNEGGGIKLEGSDDNIIGCVSGSHCGNYIRNNGDGMDEDINILLSKGMMVKFLLEDIDDKLQTTGVTVRGLKLVGKADGFIITNSQIQGLKDDLAQRLNADPEIPDGTITAGDIEDQVKKLSGSQRNIIASNVITSNVNNDEGRNIGIKLEPGSFENILVNNLITNEQVQTPSQRGLFGKLDRGIVLLSSSNKILFNAIEFLDVGIVRGGGNVREDVKHLHLFEKLAEVQTSPKKMVIVTSVEDEPLPEPVSVSATVKFNRLALNFIENNGIGIDVFDAESNLIDENLFLDNQNGGIVLSRGESKDFWGIIDIRIEENDFKGGYSIANLSILPLDVSNNWTKDSLWKGELKPPKFGPSPDEGIEVRDPFCEENFEKQDKYGQLDISDFFDDTSGLEPPQTGSTKAFLPPNMEFLPSGVDLPDEKPRACSDIFNLDDPPNPGSGSIPQLAGTQGPPKDLDRDGLYEDVNGNGRLDFDDAVALALNLSSQVVQAHQEAFDFNRNGRIDFDDAVRLAFEVGGQAAVQALKEMFGVVELKVSNVIAYANRISNTTSFIVEGQGIANIRVEIFNLGGMRVYDSDFVSGNRLSWHLENDRGATLANGVYLYIVTVKGYNGEVLRTEVRKLVVLR